MGKIRADRVIENDVWKIRFSVDLQSFSEDDRKRANKFGEPEIQTGGVFLESTPNEFEMPTKTIRIFSGLPFTAVFDSKTAPFDTNTKTKALAYEDEFIARYTQALTDLREEVDTFTGESVYNV